MVTPQVGGSEAPAVWWAVHQHLRRHLMAQPFWLFEAWRRAEVRSLLERLRPRADVPHVIAGDFNALVASDEFRREGAAMWVRAQCAVQGGWPRWALSALTNAGYTDCYRTCNDDEHGFTVPAWNPGVTNRLRVCVIAPEEITPGGRNARIERGGGLSPRNTAPFAVRVIGLEGGQVARRCSF
jgi:hypothetical protein